MPFEIIDEWPKHGVKPPALLVAVYLCRETLGRGLWSGALFSERAIAAHLRVSRGAIINAIEELEAAGRIERTLRPGRKTRIRVLLLEELEHADSRFG